MFEVGDRVVCVDDRPSWRRCRRTGEEFSYPTNLVKGGIYTVRQIIRGGTKLPNPVMGGTSTLLADHVAVGVLNWCGRDDHAATRFRKLRDISQSLAELKALTINCPPLVSA
jgi:hypothetical protein